MQPKFSPTRGLLEFIHDNLAGPNPNVTPRQRRARRRRKALINAKIGKHTAPLSNEYDLQICNPFQPSRADRPTSI